MAEIKGDSLVNRVVFKVDNNSFNDCLNKLRKAKAEIKSFSKSCGKLGKGFGDFNVIGKQAEKVSEKIARAQARIQAARIKQTTSQMTAQNKEVQAMRSYYREQEKLSAKAAKQANMIQNSRRVQAVAGLTAKNPELEKMRAYYQQEERISARVGNAAVTTAAGRKNRILANNERMVGMFDGQVVAQFQRRMQSLNAKYQKGAISLNVYNARMAILRKEMAATTATAQKMSASLSFSGLGAGIKGFAAKADSLLGSLKYVGLAGGYAMQRMISGSMGAQANYNKAYFGLLSQNNDNKQLTNEQMGFADRMASTYGMDLAKMQVDYMKFAGATKNSMGEAQRQQLYEALNVKGTAYGLSGEQFSLSAKALEQMASKSKVTMEELRQQLGDHIPGAVNDFFEAWKRAKNKSTATMQDFEKAIKNGDVKIEEISGALSEIWMQAKNTQAFAKALNMPEKVMQRMQNSLYNLKLAFMGQVDATDGVTTLSEHLINIFNSLTTVFNANKETAKRFGSVVGETLEQLYVDARIVAHYIGKLFTWVGEKMDACGLTIADVIELLVGLKVALIGIKVASAAASALNTLRTAILALKAAASLGGIGGGKGGLMGGLGRAGGVATVATLGGLGADWFWDNAIMPANNAMYGDETTAGGNLKKNSPLGKMWDGLKGWWDHGTATGKFPDWFPGQGQAVTAPLSGWRDASLSTRLPTTPATVNRGNKVEIKQQQTIKFDDNNLRNLIRITASEVTAESMGEMIDVINGGIESTRE